MTYIDISDFEPNDEWLSRFELIKAELLTKDNQEDIKNFIDQNSAFWSEIKNDFPSPHKCWISEAEEAVSPYNIEHFRPKKSVSRCSLKKPFYAGFSEETRNQWTTPRNFRSTGYWWLAFNYENFRIVGQKINSIKGDRFPLIPGSYIAYSYLDDYSLENSFLLDPTVKGDPELLVFEADGKVQPLLFNNEINHYRAVVSIEIYGLNAIDSLVKARATKWLELYYLIEDIEFFYNKIKPVLNGDQELTDDLVGFVEKFELKCQILSEKINPLSIFSSVAKNCLFSYSYEWIATYIEY